MCKRIISLILVLTVLSSLTLSYANPDSVLKTEVLTLDDGTIIKFTVLDKADFCIVEYYENGCKMQTSILDKKSESLYYYDLKSEKNNNAVRSTPYITSASLENSAYTEKYNVDDFKLDVFKSEGMSSKTSKSFRYLDSLRFNNSGKEYIRKLYGYKDTKQTLEGTWVFKAGTAVSVILSIVGYIYGLPGLIESAVGIASGLVLGNFKLQEWHKNYFWKYKFVQTSPNSYSFICADDISYIKKRKVEIDGDTSSWETFYTATSSQINYVRKRILEYPGEFSY